VTSGGYADEYRTEGVKFSYLDGALHIDVEYTLEGTNRSQRVVVDLKNAQRAKRRMEHPMGEWFEPGQSVIIRCPKERHCIKSLRMSGEHATYNALDLAYVRFNDIDTAERIAAGLTHLIHLHGGPIEINDLFEPQ
jgi:hypothetical protein